MQLSETIDQRCFKGHCKLLDSLVLIKLIILDGLGPKEKREETDEYAEYVDIMQHSLGIFSSDGTVEC